MLCKKCGKEVPEGNRFCIFCGAPMDEPVPDDILQEETPEPTMVWSDFRNEKEAEVESPAVEEKQTDSMNAWQRLSQATESEQQKADSEEPPHAQPPDLVKALVQKSTEYYEQEFYNLSNGKRSWNWPAFLVPPLWFAYRKLYGWALLAVALPPAATLLIVTIWALVYYSIYPAGEMGESAIVLSIFARFAIGFFFGTVANRQYKKRIQILIKEIPADSKKREEYFREKGGVSIGGMIVFWILAGLINVLITAIGG